MLHSLFGITHSVKVKCMWIIRSLFLFSHPLPFFLVSDHWLPDTGNAFHWMIFWNQNSIWVGTETDLETIIYNINTSYKQLFNDWSKGSVSIFSWKSFLSWTLNTPWFIVPCARVHRQLLIALWLSAPLGEGPQEDSLRMGEGKHQPTSTKCDLLSCDSSNWKKKKVRGWTVKASFLKWEIIFPFKKFSDTHKHLLPSLD